MEGVNRRTILKGGVATALALAAGRWTGRALAQDDDGFDPGGRVRVYYDETVSFNELFGNPPMLGRVEGWRLRIVEDTNKYFEAVRIINYADVVPIYGAIRAEPYHPYEHNPIWFDVGEGYIHSSYVVPVREEFHEPEEIIGKGFWGEITVPTSWQHWVPKLKSRRYYDLAYGTVYWVKDRKDEEDGRAWYRIVDDLNPKHEWWVQASHVRKHDPSEFKPISPDVPPEEKLIRINIGEQHLTCYEGDLAVFFTKIASGTSFIGEDGKVHHFNTPYGSHWVQRKTPSRHMVGGQNIDFYDLPGVPWCTFFTPSGAAIHGTYWHNDYGRPRSHGCINVTSDAAKWVYRWVNPYAGWNDDYHWTTKEEKALATPVIVE